MLSKTSDAFSCARPEEAKTLMLRLWWRLRRGACLHVLGALGPVEAVDVGSEPLGVLGDLEDPLPQRRLRHKQSTHGGEASRARGEVRG